MRTLAERRFNDIKKAIRKRNITMHVYYDGIKYPYYNNLHQFSKNKIHCSCPLCSIKSKNKGRHKKRATFKKVYNWSISDQKKFNKLEDQLLELNF